MENSHHTTLRQESGGAPTVSVVIPAYNCEKTLPACVGSVLDDSYENVELVIVDNVSTDATVETATHLRDTCDANIVLANEEKPGANAARNRGAEIATGEYVQFLDADDRLLNHKLSVSIRAFVENPRLVCVYTDGEHSGHSDSVISAAHENVMRLVERDFCEFTCGLCTAAPIWKREFLAVNKPGWDEELLCWQESEYYFRLLLSIGSDKGILHVPDRHFIYSKTVDSISSRKNTEAYMRSQYDALKRMKTYAKQQGLFKDELNEHHMWFVRDLAKRSVVSGEKEVWRLLLDDIRRGRRAGSLPMWAYMPYPLLSSVYSIYARTRRRSL